MFELVLAEDLERSLRRGRHRRRAHDKVMEEGPISVRELADALGLPCWRVVGILVGCKPSYSVARSLVAQGVCTVKRERYEHAWVVTPHPRALAKWRAERGAPVALTR